MTVSKIRYSAAAADGTEFVSTLTAHEAGYVKLVSKESEIRNGVRCGVIRRNDIVLYALSTSQSHISSSKTFKKDVAAIADTLAALQTDIVKYKDKLNLSTKRIIHNLVSLNAKNIQEIHSIVPQEYLSGAIKDHVSVVETSISENLRAAAISTLRVAKNNTAIKVEISVFNKLLDSNPTLSRRKHILHKVFMNVYYMFSLDFTDKNVHVSIQALQDCEAYFDYESIQVVLYHLLENSVKYIKRDSELVVTISEKDQSITLLLDMISVRIEEGEEVRIFEEGYSGQIPSQLQNSGAGLGMFIAKKLLQLNNSDLSLESDRLDSEVVIGVPYDRNRFTLTLPIARKK